MRMTHPGLMCGPALRVGPSQLSSEAQAMGPGVPSESDIIEIPEAPQVLPQGPEMVLGLEPELGLGPLAQVY